MRLFLTTVVTLIICLISFWIIKLWGRSQIYYEYKHALFTPTGKIVEFVHALPANTVQTLTNNENIYLDVVSTLDQKIVVLTRKWSAQEKPAHYQNYSDIKNDVVLLTDYKDLLKNKKIIFNINQNIQAAHDIFFHNMQELGLEKSENFIVTSPNEPPIKALKEIAPAFVYGTTQPEILKIVAMDSMHLIEAANIRADVIIHPLLIKGLPFFKESLLAEFKKRFKKIIIGPIKSEAEKKEAVKLNPYGLIIDL